MTIATIADEGISQRIQQRADVLRRGYEQMLWRQTDHLFAMLFVVQWLACIGMAAWLSPWAWSGLDRYIHPHVWAAVYLGGVIAIFPIGLAIFRPGQTMTRMTIAVAQMLYSALLIHLSGGRIETHFHVFGSLAFLSFYRDWRVLVPATIVIAVDHALRGIFWPESVFGVLAASPWRWVEHAGWVIFEDIFLVYACLRGAKELRMLAMRQAELETTNERVEAEVQRKTARLQTVSEELVKTARKAGMAEIATGVLHNVGNVLNSVNVAADVIAGKIHQSPVANLCRAAEMIDSHLEDLASFLTTDEKGKQLPGYISMVAKILRDENTAVVGELSTLAHGIEHIKEIVQLQQSYAKHSTVRTQISPASLLEDALRMNLLSLERHHIAVVREIADVGAAQLDQHKILQILTNLISNAKNALKEAKLSVTPTLTLRLSQVGNNGTANLRFDVIDNGVGIPPENVSRIFQHGFTTREGGHGFGLHFAANAAREMGGSLNVASDGAGLGARFTLDVPLTPVEAHAS